MSKLAKLLNTTKGTVFYRGECFQRGDPVCLRLEKVGEAHGAEKLVEIVRDAVKVLRDKAPGLTDERRLLSVPDQREGNCLLIDMVVSLVYRLNQTGILAFDRLVEAASRTLDHEYASGINTEVMLRDFNREFFKDMDVEMDADGMAMLNGSVSVAKNFQGSSKVVSMQGPIFPGPDKKLMCPVDKMEANPDNAIYDNPDDDYADILEDIREHGITTPLLVMIVGDIAIIICGHRRWAVAKKLGMTSVPVTIISDSHDQLAIKQRLVTDNIKTRPKLLWAEYGECHLLLEVQEKRALIRKGEAARRSNELRGRGENPVRDVSPSPEEEKGRARDLAANLLNLGRIGKHITGETVEKKAKVYRAFLEADPEKAQRIKEAANSGNLSAAIREMNKIEKSDGAKPRKALSQTEKLGKTLKSTVGKIAKESGKPGVSELFMSWFNIKLTDKQVTQILGETNG